MTVVLASQGYPMCYKKGFAITDVEAAEKLPGVTIYHAGTALDAEGTLRTSGGRVLDVTALGATFAEARERADRGPPSSSPSTASRCAWTSACAP